MLRLSRFAATDIARFWALFSQGKFPAELAQAVRQTLPATESRCLLNVLCQPLTEDIGPQAEQIVSELVMLDHQDRQGFAQAVSFMVKLRHWAQVSGDDCNLSRLLNEFRELSQQHPAN